MDLGRLPAGRQQPGRRYPRQELAKGQPGGVWFLAGSFGGRVTRTCTVPAGTPLVFPLVNLIGASGDCDAFMATAKGSAVLDGDTVVSGKCRGQADPLSVSGHKTGDIDRWATRRICMRPVGTTSPTHARRASALNRRCCRHLHHSCRLPPDHLLTRRALSWGYYLSRHRVGQARLADAFSDVALSASYPGGRARCAAGSRGHPARRRGARPLFLRKKTGGYQLDLRSRRLGRAPSRAGIPGRVLQRT